VALESGRAGIRPEKGRFQRGVNADLNVPLTFPAQAAALQILVSHHSPNSQEGNPMSLARIRKPTLIILSLLLALAVLSLAPQPAAPASGGNAIALKAPSFIRVANAQEEPAAAPMGFPQDEAGISAYFKSASPVTLADVRGVYRVIEVQTADYIIGSVQVADYPELYDVHVFVHRDGWFVAYYLSADPVSKMIDITNYTGQVIATLFERTLSTVAVTAGVPFPGVTFYDFRYPNATHLMLVGENEEDGREFTIKLTSAYAYYERSWALMNVSGNWYFKVDGVAQSPTEGNNPWYGVLAPAQLLPDSTHTITVDNNGVLALVYRVP